MPRLWASKSFWLAVAGACILLGLWRDSMETVTFAGDLSSPLAVEMQHYHSAVDLRITTGHRFFGRYAIREPLEMDGPDTIEAYRDRRVFPAMAFRSERDGARVFRTVTLPYWLILPNYLALAAGVVIWRRRVAGRRVK
jgi:hypothetical protein